VSLQYDALIEAGLVPAKRWGEGTDIAAAVCTLARGEMVFRRERW